MPQDESSEKYRLYNVPRIPRHVILYLEISEVDWMDMGLTSSWAFTRPRTRSDLLPCGILKPKGKRPHFISFLIKKEKKNYHDFE